MYRKHYIMSAASETQFSLRMSYLETLLIFGLLLVNYAETKVDLICLFEVRLHAHDLRKSLFRMLKRAIAIIENADAVP